MENAIYFRSVVSKLFHYVANLYSAKFLIAQLNSNIHCMPTLCHTRH